MDTKRLWKQLRQLEPERDEQPRVGPPGLFLYGGLETRADPRAYFWDGLKRGGKPDAPYAIIQYTLDGHGIYEEPHRKWQVSPGACFIAIVPSDHRYYLPRDVRPWTFFYLILLHEYAVARLAEIKRLYGPVQHFPATSAPIARMAGLFEDMRTSRFRDELAIEQGVLDMVLEMQRHARSNFFPNQREQVLEAARRLVIDRLNQSLTVEDLASIAGMSRSHYSHYFKTMTGQSPARFITETRLQEVTRRLSQRRQSLKQIAMETGFADANHLCKVFRRYFATSPGEFRLRLG